MENQFVISNLERKQAAFLLFYQRSFNSFNLNYPKFLDKIIK
ncbi:hypothetical protein pb186bvf_020136 [Paramecium bursaria]